MKQLLDRVENECPLDVGVTGHRTNRLNASDCAILQKRLGVIFEQIEAEIPGPVTLWSGMAEGTDVCAAVARPDAWRLYMILTDTVPNWTRRLEMGDATAAQIFRAEADRADASVQRVNSYRALGHRIVAHADLLIAVWDGQPGSSGGTGEVVGEAIARGIPVLHISYPLDGTERLL